MIFNLGGGMSKKEQEKTVTAGTSVIIVEPDAKHTLKKVTVKPTPSHSNNGVMPNRLAMNITPDPGYLLSNVVIYGSDDLLPENIRSGKTIFNVPGEYEGEGEHAWKKSLGSNYYPSVTIEIPQNDGSYTQCPVTLNGFAPNMTWNMSLLSGKTAVPESGSGPSLKFGTSKTLEPSLTAFCDLYRMNGSNETAIGIWNVPSDGNHIVMIKGFGSGATARYTVTLDPVNDSVFQGFVVSDAVGKYPHAGVGADGYYYEKINV